MWRQSARTKVIQIVAPIQSLSGGGIDHPQHGGGSGGVAAAGHEAAARQKHDDALSSLVWLAAHYPDPPERGCLRGRVH